MIGNAKDEEVKTSKNTQNDWETFITIKNIIFDLTDENIIESMNTLFNIFDINYSYSFNIVISQLIYRKVVTRIDFPDIYLTFLKNIEVYEEEHNAKSKLLEVFSKYLHTKSTQEAYYILARMVNHNLIEAKFVQDIKIPYFAHYLSEVEIQNKYSEFKSQFKGNFEKLKKNDWELHKKYVEEGINQNKLAKIIRNDEIEKFQKISSQPNFNYNQFIEPSIYERCSYINQKYVTLINYAAFFGSIKCFKYLLMDDVNVRNTGSFAVASGNLEIIHLCEQNKSSFSSAFETAINFHRNDIVKYLYENILQTNPESEQEIKYKNLIRCIQCNNYEILLFLQEGMKVSNDTINLIAETGNIFIVKYFLEFNKIPKTF